MSIAARLSLASHRLDTTMNQRLQGGAFSNVFFGAGAALGENAALMGVGEIESELLTEGIKMAVGRPRPDGTNSSFPDAHAGRGRHATDEGSTVTRQL